MMKIIIIIITIIIVVIFIIVIIIIIIWQQRRLCDRCRLCICLFFREQDYGNRHERILKKKIKYLDMKEGSIGKIVVCFALLSGHAFFQKGGGEVSVRNINDKTY